MAISRNMPCREMEACPCHRYPLPPHKPACVASSRTSFTADAVVRLCGSAGDAANPSQDRSQNQLCLSPCANPAEGLIGGEELSNCKGCSRWFKNIVSSARDRSSASPCGIIRRHPPSSAPRYSALGQYDHRDPWSPASRSWDVESIFQFTKLLMSLINGKLTAAPLAASLMGKPPKRRFALQSVD